MNKHDKYKNASNWSVSAAIIGSIVAWFHIGIGIVITIAIIGAGIIYSIENHNNT